jgi:dGTPase
MKRIDIEQREARELAPYAALAAKSRGRTYDEPDHELRTPFQRDRDRIIHSSAFRRMAYKTQVFIPHEQDHFRTRLTHTIEVAQVSRTLARALRLNEDLAEAIALAHDLGHTPFGHAGEDVLDELLAEYGGFNHNRQSLRIVDRLETRYPEHDGLNLSYEVREGIAKHETSVDVVSEEFSDYPFPTLEASLVDLADEITYNAHDVDDGLVSGLVTIDDLRAADFWSELSDPPFPSRDDTDGDMYRYRLVRYLLDFATTDLIDHSRHRLMSLAPSSVEDVRNSTERIASHSESVAKLVRSLKLTLHDRLYRHPHLISRSDHARQVIESLFDSFQSDTTLLPERFQQMIDTEPRPIVVADYIAGMTDRFAIARFDSLR